MLCKLSLDANSLSYPIGKYRNRCIQDGDALGGLNNNTDTLGEIINNTVTLLVR